VLALAEAHGIEITRSIEDALTNTSAPTDPAPELHAAYLTIARFSGDADKLLAEYQKTSETMSTVGRDHGMILHAAAKTAIGFLILNLWPSKDRSEAAANDPRRLVHASPNSDRFGGVRTRLSPPVGIADASASTHPTPGLSHAQPLANSLQNFWPRALGVLERAKISPNKIHREHHDIAHFVVFDSPTTC
jgi:hypothetical protein